MKNAALLVDFYALTMANVYQRFLPQAQATFDLFIRNLPKNRSFLVACGINDALSYLKSFAFTKDDIAYLKRFNFDNSFLKLLKNIKFRGEVWAVREGTLIFPGEPILRITAPLVQAQLLEAYLLNTINIQSAIASKAARVVIAAKSRPVFDFSLRRTHGPAASLQVARASYVAGCSGTSNVSAGKLLGIKVMGTMAHSFVMSFNSELESFRAYAKTFPNQAVLLLDTYNYRQGIKNALIIAKELKQKGFRLMGVRLDSGNLIKESKKIRSLLDKNGFSYVKILASGNLDEFKIERLVKAKAPIDSFGVGTNMGVSSDAPYCDVVYKISEINSGKVNFSPTMKLSRNKVTYPGRKQIYRIKDAKGNFKNDVIALEHERQKGEPLLMKMMEKGRTLRKELPLAQVRKFVNKQINELPPEYKKLKTNKIYSVMKSTQLKRLTNKLSQQLKTKN
jgi:nicotinate phosphoribosyltransferase